jgi:hypothetical protein
MDTKTDIPQPPDTQELFWCPVCGHTESIIGPHRNPVCHGAWQYRNMTRGRDWKTLERKIKEAEHPPTDWVRIEYVRKEAD